MSRSRRKLDTSPIDYDEVVDSPALKGMVSFLEVAPGGLPHLDFSSPATASKEVNKSGIPLSGIPDSGVPNSTIPVTGIPNIARAPSDNEKGTPETGIPFSDKPLSDTQIPSTAYPPAVSHPVTRIRRASLAQDGHSFGEQALYDALWQHAHPHDAETRIITIGYHRMSGLARLTVNNCKANIQSLIQKLALDEVASFTHSQGRTYLVYSYAAILQRRRDAGLTHFIKSRGVAFVDPDTGESVIARTHHKSGIPVSGTPLSGIPDSGIPEGGESGIPQSGESGIPQSGGPPYSKVIRNNTRNTTTTTNESAPPELIRGLRQLVAFLDDEAASVLWRQCRRHAADCTPEEVLHFTRGKAAVFSSGKIQNPTGFLLAVVPKCFEGESFLAYRHEQERLRQLETARARDAEEQNRQMRREFETILEDPESSEEDRRFVRRMLEGN